jgi:D-glycero-alpha-D-manno-heptose-7-phosphate kinase
MENVGSQDQIASALGGMNYIKFDSNLDWQATPVTMNFKFQESITNRIVLIYTGIQRTSSDIQANLLMNLDKKIERCSVQSN